MKSLIILLQTMETLLVWTYSTSEGSLASLLMALLTLISNPFWLRGFRNVITQEQVEENSLEMTQN